MNFEQQTLELAWRRYRADRPHRCFVDHPWLIEWIESRLDTWLDELGVRLADSEPSQAQLCLVPKPHGQFRPAHILKIEDELRYNALLLRLFPEIHSTLSRNQPEPDVAYQLRSPENRNDWVFRGVRFWKQWRGRSLRLLEQAKYVVFADVAGFYDNIDLDRLGSDIRTACGACHEVPELMKCLRIWAHSRGKGIPQGYSASDILAKLYMKPLDQAIRNAGYCHLRYVDDIRVFCGNRIEAERSVEQLSIMLFQRGLTIQSAKTRILDKQSALEVIDGVAPLIEKVHGGLRRELKKLAKEGDLYLSAEEITELLGEEPAGSPAVLEEAFRQHAILPKVADVNGRLLRFLLNRLAIVNSRAAVSRCMELLQERPEEIQHILSYFQRIGLKGSERQRLVRFLCKKRAFRQHPRYLVLRWLLLEGRQLKQVLGFCRELIRDQNTPSWTRAYALAYIGDHGEQSDLEELEQRYASLHHELERAEYLYAMRRQERSRRIAIYRRAR